MGEHGKAFFLLEKQLRPGQELIWAIFNRHPWWPTVAYIKAYIQIGALWVYAQHWNNDYQKQGIGLPYSDVMHVATADIKKCRYWNQSR
jgi:hypothetical protein